MYLVISNKGLVEPGALSLMGASVKDGEAIGKFGSGFKYALATLLREDFAIRIFSGEIELRLETRPEVFREQTFQVLWIDGIRTSITTRTGVEWKPRDAVREIYSNALDESDAGWAVEAEAIPRPGYTTIAIECKGEIEEMTENWEMYFSRFVPAVFEHLGHRILSQKVTNYYRRGIWICEDREDMGLYSYDFDEISLPESRKIASASTRASVYHVLYYCTSERIWSRLLDHIETNCMEWNALGAYSLGYLGLDTFKKVFAERYDFFGNSKFRDKIGESKKRVLWVSEKRAYTLLKMGLPNIADEVDFTEKFTVVPWPIGLKEKLNEPLARLKKIGVNMTKFDIRFVEYHEDDPPIAFVHNRKCYLTSKAFDAHPNMLLKALVEEWTHLEHNVLDHTVAQQHVYLDLIVSLIPKGGE